jgi:hypothetical protein
MEITTLIKWNSIIYLLYYAINFAFDYIRNPNRQKEKSVQYSYQDMLHAAPVKVEVPETSSAESSVAKAIKEKAQAAKKIQASNPITLDGPVEDQGIPYEEIMQNAKAYTKGINF